MFNVAIFGAGRIGQIHGRNAAALPELTLKYVVDPNRAAADALARQTAAQVVDMDAALGDASVSGVIIASATNAHLDQSLSAAAAGKAIFCEKPLDLDLARARDAARSYPAQECWWDSTGALIPISPRSRRGLIRMPSASSRA